MIALIQRVTHAEVHIGDRTSGAIQRGILALIGVAKGEDSLRLRVNGIIDEAKKNGELDKLSMKWLERPAGELPQ